MIALNIKNKHFIAIIILTITSLIISCKKEKQDSELEYDNQVNKLLSGVNLNSARLNEVCSATSLKVFIANAEKFSHISWATDISEADLALAAKYEKSFEYSIKSGRDDFIAAHKKKPTPCNEKQNPVTYILSIFDGGSNTPDSSIDLIKLSFIGGEWKPASLALIYDYEAKKITPQQNDKKFELNMATDVVEIVSQVITTHVPKHDQVELYINGHGGRALSSPDMTDQVNLFDDHQGTQNDHLILFDTHGHNMEKLTSKLWSPIWKKSTVEKICDARENSKFKDNSIVCLALENGNDRQVGSAASGEEGGTSGEEGGTSGDSGNTSGKIFRRVMPKIDKTKPFSHTNPEGIVQAGAVSSYTISKDLYNELGISKISFYFPKVNKPSYVLLNSCYQNEKIKNAIFSNKEAPFYTSLNSGPIYSWLVDYKLLNDYKYRVMPHLFFWRDQINSSGKVSQLPQDSPDRRIHSLANKLESYTNNGLNGKRVQEHSSTKSMCKINSAYCQIKTRSMKSLIWTGQSNK